MSGLTLPWSRGRRHNGGDCTTTKAEAPPDGRPHAPMVARLPHNSSDCATTRAEAPPDGVEVSVWEFRRKGFSRKYRKYCARVKMSWNKKTNLPLFEESLQTSQALHQIPFQSIYFPGRYRLQRGGYRHQRGGYRCRAHYGASRSCRRKQQKNKSLRDLFFFVSSAMIRATMDISIDR
jgi:hypothetical protein